MLKKTYLSSLNLLLSKPNNLSPYQVRRSTVLYEKNPGDHDVVLHENFLGTGVAAFETHGVPFYSVLMNSRGKYRSAREVAETDIRPWLQRINYPPGKEMILLACLAGSSGAAQVVATVLRRPVEGFKHRIYVLQPHYLRHACLSERSNDYNLPTENIGLLKRLSGFKGPFIDSRNQTYAQSKTYYPQ